uniref:Lateral suppressor n=1 Tax=Zoysia japonica TaxID=309978 RepID=W8VJT6_9POAL|nr:lateral suppressor [Zoysia japonica]
MLGAPGGGRDDHGEAQPHENRVGPAAAPSSPRELVLACADRLHRGDVDGARRVVEALLSLADPRSDDAADRLAYHFARALARRVDGKGREVAESPVPPAPSPSAYLAYNQMAPFLRFAHLTANQAILEAAATGVARRVHIVDLDAAHGVQWPPLLQAIAERADPDLGPPEVRITGAGTDRDVIHRTGDRLRAFASSLNLPFRFHPFLLPCPTQLAAYRAISTGLELHPDETLVVNCVLFLHQLGGEGEVADFLRWVKSMNPTVVTIAEREASIGGYCPNDLPRRVAAAMDYYSAVFDALEAMVPPGSADRLSVEHEILGQEIDAAIDPCLAGGMSRRFEWWASAARAAGLSPRPLSTFAVSQARFLLRLHYPSEGYVVEEARGACFLGWQTRPLMSVSSWQSAVEQ